MECLDICADLDIVETLEMNFDSCKKNLMEFRERFSEWIKGIVTYDEEVCSRVSSTTISSTSSKAKLRTARANRLKAEHQLKKTEEKLKLEHERRELEMKEQLLEKQSELEEAKLEELVWQETFNEDNETINANQNKGTSTEVSMCSNRNNNLKNSDINIQGIPATIGRTDSEAKCEFTLKSENYVARPMLTV
jgi:hypothetical protein